MSFRKKKKRLKKHPPPQYNNFLTPAFLKEKSSVIQSIDLPFEINEFYL